MSGVSNEHTDGTLMLTLILLGDGSITCHDITVSFKHTGGTVMLTFIHVLGGGSVACRT